MGTNVIVVIRTCQDKPLIRKCKVPDVMLQSRHKTKKIFYTGLILFHRTFFRLRMLVFFSRTFFHRQPQSAPTVRSVLPLRAARDGSSRNVVASARCAARATRPLPGCLCSRAERSRRGRGAGSREQGGRRRLRRPTTRPGGTSCRGQARGKFACACAGQLCAQQRLAGSLCRGAACRPKKGG